MLLDWWRCAHPPNMFLVIDYNNIWIFRLLISSLMLKNIKKQLINLGTLTQFVEQKCLHFHTGGKLIQESIINCSSGPITCPKAYRSTEAYKCNPSFLIILMLYTFFDQTSRNQIFSVWRSIFITWAEIYI